MPLRCPRRGGGFMAVSTMSKYEQIFCGMASLIESVSTKICKLYEQLERSRTYIVLQSLFTVGKSHPDKLVNVYMQTGQIYCLNQSKNHSRPSRSNQHLSL